MREPDWTDTETAVTAFCAKGLSGVALINDTDNKPAIVNAIANSFDLNFLVEKFIANSLVAVCIKENDPGCIAGSFVSTGLYTVVHASTSSA